VVRFHPRPPSTPFGALSPGPIAGYRRSAPQAFRGSHSTVRVPLAPACPDFLLRGTNHDHACGFLSRKAASSRSTPPTSTGNPGYVGRKRWAKPTTAFRSRPYRCHLEENSQYVQRNSYFVLSNLTRSGCSSTYLTASIHASSLTLSLPRQRGSPCVGYA
jgi:hypothetical protein